MSEAGNEAKRPARRCDECCRAVATTEVVADEYVADRREPGGLASGGLLGDQGERLRQFFYAALDARVHSGPHLGPLLHGILDAPRRDGAAEKGPGTGLRWQHAGPAAGARPAPARAANAARRRPLCSNRSGTWLIRLSSPDTNPRSIGTGGLPRRADTVVLEEERCISRSTPAWSARCSSRSGRRRSGTPRTSGNGRAAERRTQQGIRRAQSRRISGVAGTRQRGHVPPGMAAARRGLTHVVPA